MKLVYQIVLSGLILGWICDLPVAARNITLNSTFTWPRTHDDSVTYTVAVHSSAQVKPGTYKLTGQGSDIRNITIQAGGTVHDDGYYGGPATISSDQFTITFTFLRSYNLDITTGGAGTWRPPSPYSDSAHPPISFNFQVVDSSNHSYGIVPETYTAVFLWDTVKYLFGQNYLNTQQQYQEINYTDYVDFYLDPRADPSAPGCNEHCPNCHMAGYSFDMQRAGLRITDTPVSYSPPVGPGVAFTATYNQANLGQLSSLPVSNLGTNWTYNWLTYIIGNPEQSVSVQRFVPGGGLESYFSFSPTGFFYDTAGAHAIGTFAPDQHGHSILNWDPANHRYVRQLPDGASEIYSQVVSSNGINYYLITQQSDPQGNALTFNYDSQNRLISVVDAVGQVTTLTYALSSDSFKITAVSDPFGRRAKFIYAGGLLASSQDPLNILSSYAYDGTNFLNSLTTPYGTTTFSTDSDAGHQAVQATNPLGQTERVELRYTSAPGIADTDTVPTVAGLFNSATVVSGLSSYNTFYWDRRAYADGAGDYTKAQMWHWMVGSQGLTSVPLCQKKALEGRVWMNYQGQTDSNYIPDDGLNGVTITARLLDSSATQATTATYSPTGLITKSVDPLGRTTNYTYDPSNNIDLLQVTQTNATSSSGFDILSALSNYTKHLPQTTTDAAGQVTTIAYNTQGQVTSRTVVVNSANQITTMTYTGPNGTGAGNYLTLVTGPGSGATTSYSYDSVGRVQKVTDSEGYALTTAYDNFDRKTATTYPDGTTDQTFYKNLDVDHTVDRQGRLTRNTYDAIRELISTTDPLNRTTQYSWCTCGGLSTLTDANNHVTTWGLDLQGRVTSKTYADASAITYIYETNMSRLHSMADAKGNKATYSYNSDNTLSGTVYTLGTGSSATSNVSFTYDTPYNRVLTMVDLTGTTTYAYNQITGTATLGAGRLSSVSVPILGTGKTASITYAYDELGRVVTRGVDHATTNANNLGATFDALGRVTNVSNALGAFVYAYVNTPGPSNRLASVTYPTATGLTANYSYFPNSGDQRLQDITNKKGTTSLSKFDYTYNPVGTIATWTQQADSSTAALDTLTYDNADQLASAVQSGGATASNKYNYDPAGNRLTETTLTTTTAGQFNNVNQLQALTSNATAQTVSGHTSAAVTTLNVNAVPATISNSTNFTASVPLPAGTNIFNVVAQPSAGVSTTARYQTVTTGTTPTKLSYDKNGNVLTDESGNTYTWDALNRLTAIVYHSGATHTEFSYDGLSRRVQIVERAGTVIGSGAISSTKNYLWIGQEIAEERDTSNNITKRFFSQGEQQSGTNYYYTTDHLGSTREMCNSSGAIVARYSYDPYGRTTLVSGSNLATFQYTGDYTHLASGLNLTKYRAYDPNTGRWLNRDPIEEMGGDNLFAYCNNSPIDFSDPLGLKGPAPSPTPPVKPSPVPPKPDPTPKPNPIWTIPTRVVTVIVETPGALATVIFFATTTPLGTDDMIYPSPTPAKEASECKKVTCKIVSIEPPNEHGLGRINVECSDGSSYFFHTGDTRPYRVGQSMPSTNPTIPKK